MAEAGGAFINVDKLDLRKYAARPALARRCATTSCITIGTRRRRWSWRVSRRWRAVRGLVVKKRLGKGYYQLGLLRDAEKQFRSSMKDCNMIPTVLQLAKIYIRLDQPFAAIHAYEQGAAAFPGETSMLLGQRAYVTR